MTPPNLIDKCNVYQKDFSKVIENLKKHKRNDLFKDENISAVWPKTI
jgi:hypothetical protein